MAAGDFSWCAPGEGRLDLSDGSPQLDISAESEAMGAELLLTNANVLAALAALRTCPLPPMSLHTMEAVVEEVGLAAWGIEEQAEASTRDMSPPGYGTGRGGALGLAQPGLACPVPPQLCFCAPPPRIDTPTNDSGASSALLWSRTPLCPTSVARPSPTALARVGGVRCVGRVGCVPSRVVLQWYAFLVSFRSCSSRHNFMVHLSADVEGAIGSPGLPGRHG